MKKKNLYVIGGSGLIGSSFINSLSSSEYNIFNLDIKNNVKKNKSFFIKFNCANLINLSKNLNKIFKKYGEPNILVNCSYPTTSDWVKNNFKDIKIKNFIKNLNIHLGSYCWILKIFADQMKKNNLPGKIVMLGSIYGSMVAQNEKNYKNTNMRENMTYPVIKSGLIGATKQFAQYYGKNKILINLVCPGLIKGHVKGMKNKQDKKFLKKYLEKTSIKRICNPEEISEIINFLISKKNTYITGQSIIIDGGYTLT